MPQDFHDADGEDDGDERTYYLSVEAAFIADDVADAVRQMVEHLHANAQTLTYAVRKDGWPSAVEVDADDLQ